MTEDFLLIKDSSSPQILAAEKDFLIVYKAPRMHSAPIPNSTGETILEWCISEFPEIANLPGRRPGEGGLLHRLDYDTQGLLLLARSRKGMSSFLEQQKQGKIIKEYSAFAMKSKMALQGFPIDKPELPLWVFSGGDGKDYRALIKSAFRPYGPGRKAVRPATLENIQGEKWTGKKKRDITLDGSEQYLTEIIKSQCLSAGIISLRIMIYRGFRHQIRSHLCWLGLPILNDSLYGGPSYGRDFLGLRACSISFTDPASGRERCFSIPPLELDEISDR